MQRPYLATFRSHCPSGFTGGFCRWIKTQNRRVGQTHTRTTWLTAHRQTDQRALVEIIQRPSVWAGSPIQNLSVRPSDCPGRFRRRIKTRNCRVSRTHVVNLYIRFGYRPDTKVEFLLWLHFHYIQEFLFFLGVTLVCSNESTQLEKKIM
jgi:hypothetical protein